MSLVQTVSQFRCDFRRVQRDINDVQTLIVQTWLGAINGRKWYTVAKQLNEQGYNLVEKFKERLYTDYQFQCLRYALYALVHADGNVATISQAFNVPETDLRYLRKLIRDTSFSPPAIVAELTAKNLLSRDEVFELITRNSTYFKRLVDSPKFYYLSQAYVSAESLENRLFFKAWTVALRNLDMDPHRLENTIKSSVKNCLIDIARRHTAHQRNKHMLVSSERIAHGTLTIRRDKHMLQIVECGDNQWQFEMKDTCVIVCGDHINGELLGDELVPIGGPWAIDKQFIYCKGENVGKWCSYQTRKDFDLREFSISGPDENFNEDRNISLIDHQAQLQIEKLECRLSGAAYTEPESEDLHPQIVAKAKDYYNRDLFRQAIPLFKKALSMKRDKSIVMLLADSFFECRMYYWAWRYYKQVNRDATVKLILAELRRYDFKNDISPGQRVVYKVKGAFCSGRVQHVHKNHIYILRHNSLFIEKISKSQICAFSHKSSVLEEDYDINSDLNQLVCVKIGDHPQVVARTLNALPTGYHVLCVSHFAGRHVLARYPDISPCSTHFLSLSKLRP